jgi:hypothetical protein
MMHFTNGKGGCVITIWKFFSLNVPPPGPY